MSYSDRLKDIALDDAEVLKDKDAQYGGSWLKRGGIGAFMMAARKWDRLETSMTTTVILDIPVGMGEMLHTADKWDIITRAVVDEREEGLLDDIGDLRRYLLLIEAEIREQLAHRADVFSPTSPSGAPIATPGIG